MARPNTNYFMGIEGRGFSFFTVSRPSRKYPEGRRCSVLNCATVLSVYNKHGVCWAHLDPKPVNGNSLREKRHAAAV